ALKHLPDIKAQATQARFLTPIQLNALQEHPQVYELLCKAIVENPPMILKDGGVIARGYNKTLDELQTLSETAEGFLKKLEEKEQARTQLSTLKVGYNRVHGYYIEISRAQAAQVPSNYLRRQTLKNAE